MTGNGNVINSFYSALLFMTKWQFVIWRFLLLNAWIQSPRSFLISLPYILHKPGHCMYYSVVVWGNDTLSYIYIFRDCIQSPWEKFNWVFKGSPLLHSFIWLCIILWNVTYWCIVLYNHTVNQFQSLVEKIRSVC